MSHVATVDVEIKNLDWLAKACRKIGLEFVRGQTEFFAYRDRDCDHAIRVPGQQEILKKARAYEVGLTARTDGRPGWQLSYDLFLGGRGMQAFVGDKCSKLVQAYTTVAARETAMRQGMRVSEQMLADGSIRLVLSK